MARPTSGLTRGEQGKRNLPRAWDAPTATAASFHTRQLFEGISSKGISGFQSGGSLGSAISFMLRLSEDETMSRPYVQSATIFACIQAIGRAIVQFPLKIWDGRGTDSNEVPESDALVRLMRRPNPTQSERKFWKTNAVYMQLAGGSFWFLNRAFDGIMRPIEEGAFPDEIWPVREDLVEAVIDEGTHMPTGWKFVVGGKSVEYPAHAVSHIYDIDPSNPLRGLGPMQAAYRTANVSYKAQRFDEALVENGGQIGGILTHENAALPEEKRRAIERGFHENRSRAVHHRKVAVMPHGMKFTPTAWSPTDMDFSGLREWNRQEIMMVFGCTKPLLGITDDVNLANGREARRVFYENTIVPLIDFFEDEVNRDFISRLPRPFNQYDVRFDRSGVAALRESIDAQLDRVEKLMGMGLSFSEAAALIGWNIDPSAIANPDDHWIQSGLQLRDQAAEPTPATPTPRAAREGKSDGEAEDTDNFEFIEYPSGLTRVQRLDYLKAFEDSLEDAEDQLTRRVHRVFRDFLLAQRKWLREIAAGEHSLSNEPTVIRPWEDLDTKDMSWLEVKVISEAELEHILITNLEKWNKELWGAAEGPIRGIVDEASRALAEELGGVSLSTTNPEMVSFMSSKQVRLIEGPMTQLAQQVRRALVKGLAEGPSIGTLAERVRAVLVELEKSISFMIDRAGTRAAMIARTEATAAANGSRMLTMKTNGIGESEWLTARDEHVRDSHRIDGERAVVGQQFSNTLRYPGDVLATDAGLVVNCRCTTIPIKSDA